MKKIFLAMIAGMSLLACNNSDNGGDLTGDSTTMQNDTLNQGQGLTTDTSMNNTMDTGMGNRNPVDSAGLRDTMRRDNTRVDSTR